MTRKPVTVQSVINEKLNRPDDLCCLCRPGSPCPWCVANPYIDAWALAMKWKEECESQSNAT